jgi:hypothetical protein
MNIHNIGLLIIVLSVISWLYGCGPSSHVRVIDIDNATCRYISYQEQFSKILIEYDRHMGFVRSRQYDTVKTIFNAPLGNAGRVTDLRYDDTGLLNWSYVNVGDYDSSGEVNIADINMIVQNYLAMTNDGIGDDALQTWIDASGDGEVGVPDITPIAQGYLNEVVAYRILTSSQLDSGFVGIGEDIPFGDPYVFPKTFSVLLPVGVQQYVAVAPVDSDGNVGEMSYAVAILREWHTETVDNNRYCGIDSSIDIDSLDRPCVAYYDGNNIDLKYARWNDVAWEIVTVDSIGNVGYGTSLAMDSGDHAHISYYDFDNGNLKYAYYNGSEWSVTTADDNANDVGFSTSIAVDSNNKPHISYYDVTNHVLKYTYSDGSAWIITDVIPSGDLDWSSSLALDVDDSPHIAFTRTDLYAFTEPYYATLIGGQWITDTVDSFHDIGAYVSIDVDSNGYPYVCYYDEVEQDLIYSYNNGSSWESEIIDSIGDVGSQLSMTLDSSDHQHICYTEYSYIDGEPDNNLKYAYFDGYGWNISTVDSEGYVGNEPSIAVDSLNRPYISYYDDDNQSLKHAWLEWK